MSVFAKATTSLYRSSVAFILNSIFSVLNIIVPTSQVIVYTEFSALPSGNSEYSLDIF